MMPQSARWCNARCAGRHSEPILSPNPKTTLRALASAHFKEREASALHEGYQMVRRTDNSGLGTTGYPGAESVLQAESFQR